MHPLVAPLHGLFRLHTRLYLNCLEGVDDHAARRRPDGRTNSLAFVAVHLVDARHFLAAYLAAEAANPFAALLKDARGIDDVEGLPGVEEVRAAWRGVSEVLDARLAALTEEEIRAASPQAFPVEDRSVLGGIAFLAHHDAYHVGQMALLRKHLGFGPMQYR